MSELAPQPNPSQEQLTQSIDAARLATRAADQYSTEHRDGLTREHMHEDYPNAGAEVPYLMVTDGENSQRVGAFVSTPNAEIQAHSVEDNNGVRGSLKVEREVNGEKYQFTTHRAEAAQKFGSLIAKQVANRADAARNEQNTTA